MEHTHKKVIKIRCTDIDNVIKVWVENYADGGWEVHKPVRVRWSWEHLDFVFAFNVSKLMPYITRKQYFRNNNYPFLTWAFIIFGSIALIAGWLGASVDWWWIPGMIFYAAAIVIQVAGSVAYRRYVAAEKAQKVDKLKIKEQ